MNENDAPLAQVVEGNGQEGGLVSTILRATDIDNDAADIDVFRFEITQQPSLRARDDAGQTIPVTIANYRWEDGAFLATATYLHNGDEVFGDGFQYRAFDGEDYSEVVDANVTITPVNDPPVAFDMPRPGEPDDEGIGEEGGEVSARLIATDVDTDALGEPPVADGEVRDVSRFEFRVILPEGVHDASVYMDPVSYDAAQRTFSTTISYTHSGIGDDDDVLRYTAFDGVAESEEKTVVIPIIGVPDRPFINVGDDANFRMNEDDGPYRFQLNASDEDSADLVWEVVRQPLRGQAVMANGGIGIGDPRTGDGNTIHVEYTPPLNYPGRADQGEETFTVRVFNPDEAALGLRSEELEIRARVDQVNDAPRPLAGLSNHSMVAGQLWSHRIFMRRTRHQRPAFVDVEDDLALRFSAHLPGDDADGDPFSGAPLPPWLLFDQGRRTFQANPGDDHVGQYTIRVVAWDSVAWGNRASAPNDPDGKGYTDFTLTVLAFNAAPQISHVIEDQVVDQGQELSFTSQNPVFADPDGPGALALSAQGTDENMDTAFDAEGRFTFRWMPENTHVDDLNRVVLRAEDARENVTTTQFQIRVNNVNDDPQVNRGIGNRCVRVGQVFDLSIARVVRGQRLQTPICSWIQRKFELELSAPAEVDWIALNPEQNSMVGQVPHQLPLVDGMIEYGLSVTATDRVGRSAQSDFTLRVIESTAIDEDPEAVGDLPDRVYDEDQNFTFNVPMGIFFDDDDNQDFFTFTAAAYPDGEEGDPHRLPDWLEFDPDAMTFTGTARNRHVRALPYLIGVRAQNCSGTEVTVFFTITILNVNDPPYVGRPGWDQDEDGGSGNGGGSDGQTAPGATGMPDQYVEANECTTSPFATCSQIPMPETP